MSKAATIRAYLSAMEQGDMEGVLRCFSEDGIIRSPVYGEVPVERFYEKLFADTKSAEVHIKAIYASVDDENRWAAHFGYRWVKVDGSVVDTDLVDLFEFDGEKALIASLRIVFDPKQSAAPGVN